MKDIKGCLLHNTDDWKTPSSFYKNMLDHGFIDPCPYMSNEDGLKKSFSCQKLYVYPPFSKLDKWCDWVIEQVKNNSCEVLLLMPSRTDTRYFHKLVGALSPSIFFIKGRLHFNDSKKVAPFPTILLWCDKRFTLPFYLTCTLDEVGIYIYGK